MSPIKSIILLSLSLAVAAIACKKEKHPPHPSSLVPTVSLSKSTVKRGEPLVASIHVTAGSSPVVKWTVNPGSNSILSATASASTILFPNSGRYTIMANYYADSAAPHPYDSSSSPVTVNDSIYTDTMIVHCNTLINAPVASGDLITLMPLYNKDTGLVLIALTQQTYPDVPSLGFLSSGDAEHFNFTITGITEYPCGFSASPNIAIAVLNLGNPADGVYPISVNLAGVIYSGSLTVASSTITFSWNYNKGVVIAPLQVSK